MTIAIDKPNIGTNITNASGTLTVALTTSQTVASGGFIVLGITWFATSGILTGVSGGGLSWSIDAQDATASVGVALVSAQAPSGLASSTVITATNAAVMDVPGIGGTSFTGVKTSSPLDGTPGTAVDDIAWTTGSRALTAGSVLIGLCYNLNTADTANTPVAPSLEAYDVFRAGDTYGQCVEYRIESSAGSYAVAGNYPSGTDTKVAYAAYLAAAGGSSSVLTADHGMGMGRW